MTHVRDACGVSSQVVLVMGLACAPAFCSADSPDHPRWAVRVTSGGQSYFIDEPNCHPSEYFERDVQHFNYHHGLDSKQQACLQDPLGSRRIGEIARRKIQQVDHIIDQNELTVKMLLIERKSGEFCEIYHQEWTGDSFYNEVLPARLLDHYWRLSEGGPVDLLATDKPCKFKKESCRRAQG